MICSLQKQISHIENEVKTVESDLNKFIAEAESLKNEQQRLITKLQERKNTAKGKQVYHESTPY